MAADGSIILDTQIDTSGIERDAKKIEEAAQDAAQEAENIGDGFEEAEKEAEQAANEIEKDLNKLELSMNDIARAAGVAFGIDQLIDFGGAALDAASDLIEVQNVVDTAFGDMTGQVEEFASTALTQFGLTELAAKSAASQYMAMSSGMGLTGQAAADMSINIASLTGDMSSFYNVSQSVAQTALASIWTGETESLKQFGIVMTQANLQNFAYAEGITKTIDELTQAELVQLRYQYVMGQTTLAQGDFAKTSDSWANQNRVLEGTLTKLSAVAGEGLMDALNPLLEILLDIVNAVLSFQDTTGLLDEFFTVLIGGITGLLAVSAVKTITDIVAAVQAMGAAALFANLSTGLMAAAIGALVLVLLQLASSWSVMSDIEKGVAVLGALAAVAFTAAIAVGAFQSAATLGLAAIAIAAGIAAVMVAVNSAQQRADVMSQQTQYPTIQQWTPELASQSSQAYVPKLATGAVIPPNREFHAILGDQKHGRNLEAPESLIRTIVREESGKGSSGANVRLESGNGFERYLNTTVRTADRRKGSPLISGRGGRR